MNSTDIGSLKERTKSLVCPARMNAAMPAVGAVHVLQEGYGTNKAPVLVS
ncbi:hypothetical protein [Streptomyces sp. NPDC059631]